MKITCEICGENFRSTEECNEHEKTCKGKLVKFKCGICKKTKEYYSTIKFNQKAEMIKAQCWIFPMNVNYGSIVPANSKLNICDECAYEFAEKPEMESWEENCQ